jgi:hypothetical protein
MIYGAVLDRTRLSITPQHPLPSGGISHVQNTTFLAALDAAAGCVAGGLRSGRNPDPGANADAANAADLHPDSRTDGHA